MTDDANSDVGKGSGELFDKDRGDTLTIPSDIPEDVGEMREGIGNLLGFEPENPDSEFTRLETAEIYAALKDARDKR
ncbi:MAG: hypothetical protein ABEI86_04490 [Halobacteriaceae archaeon]